MAPGRDPARRVAMIVVAVVVAIATFAWLMAGFDTGNVSEEKGDAGALREASAR
ncbi:MAG TPA: hypothetical protein VGI39_06575 [Polyangiaceae bacterium]|jgi:hypothetical protein